MPAASTPLKRPERAIAKSKPKSVSIDPAGNPILIVNPAVVTKTIPEPSFSDLATELGTAEAAAKAATADAGAAKAHRSTVAVDTIKAAFREKVAIADVRKALLDGGVLKGTVSKIATILQALTDGTLTPNDVKSLNGAYNTVKTVAAVVAGGTVAPGATAAFAPRVTKGATTIEEAIALIIQLLKQETDPDVQFKLAGEIITDVSNGVKDAMKATEEEGEGL